MVNTVLIVLVLAVASGIYLEEECGCCLCTFYEDGCVTANCSNRNVSSLPVQVPNQTCFLTMRDNEMRIVQDGDFQRLINLTYLDLSANQIDEIGDGGFLGMSKLRSLNLSDNSLNFTLTKTKAEAFEPLIQLETLDLRGNSYTEYPGEHLSVLLSLKTIFLDGLQNQSFGACFLSLRNLSTVNLSGGSQRKCNITSLYKGTFDNVRAIKSLNLSHCNISYVEPHAFAPLESIEILDMSFNQYLYSSGFRNVLKGLQKSRLRRLVINQIVRDDAVCVVVTKSLVENVENTTIEQIEADDNRIEKLDVEALSILKGVRHISARNSRLSSGSYIKQLNLLRNLTFLDLSGNHDSRSLFHDFADPSDETNDDYAELATDSYVTRTGNYRHDDHLLPSHYRKMYSVLSHLNNGKQGHLKVRLPPQLKTLNYSFAELKFYLSDIHLAENSLEYIDLSNNILTYWSGPVTGVENVTHLDLSCNVAQYVNLTFFENFKSLKYLNISRNYLSRSVFFDTNGTLFQKLSRLESLDVSGNVLFKLQFRSLEGLPSLTSLFLSDNSIYTLDINYTANTKLQFINVSHNHIRIIPEGVRQILDHLATTNNLSLDLSWNPFDCTCHPEHLNFLDWLNTTNVRLENKEHNMCVIVGNTDINVTPVSKRYPELKDSCKDYKAVLTMVLLSAIVLFTTVTFCGIAYRYRWRLIYVYYVGKRKLKGRTRRPSQVLYDFDAFVSYADQDIDFVTTLMTTRLELNQGMNLYIRDRDSVPGATIAENIIDGIQRSKKSILLISGTSLTKKWNRYELQMANMEEISTKRDVMIIVMLEFIPATDIPTEILYHVQNSTPLQYPVDDSVQADMFWASLTEAIRS